MGELKEYFEGKKLYGDDFNIEQIKEWFNDEEEGYSEVYQNYQNKNYVYHKLNKIFGYNKIDPKITFDKVVSFGGGNGEELLPIINRINEIYIIEPSKKLRVKDIQGKKIKYISPTFSGKINLEDNSIDLITCFGTLHHTPNVSFIFNELVRILKEGGFLLIREPIVSMGDWTKYRRGLTKRERGIPLSFFRDLIKKEKLEIISEERIMFPLMNLLNRLNKKNKEISTFSIKLDHLFSKIFSINCRYHSTRQLHKLQPQAVFYVLKKKKRLKLKEVLK